MCNLRFAFATNKILLFKIYIIRYVYLYRLKSYYDTNKCPPKYFEQGSKYLIVKFCECIIFPKNIRSLAHVLSVSHISSMRGSQVYVIKRDLKKISCWRMTNALDNI